MPLTASSEHAAPPFDDGLLQALFASEDAVFLYLADSTGLPRSLIYVNDAACLLIGRSREELLTDPHSGFTNLNKAEQAPFLLRELHHRHHIRFESEVVTAQGLPISVEVTAMLTTYYDQTAVVVICRNIEALRRKEKLFRIVKRRYRAIIQDQTEAIFRFLPTGRLTFINQAGCRAFGLTAAAALKSNLFSLLPAENAEGLKNHLSLLTKDMTAKTLECTIRRPSGEEAAFEWTIRAICTAGRISEYQVAGRDITCRKKLENELEVHRHSLENLVRERTAELEAAHSQLEHELVNRLVVNIALKESEEQLRTLINAMPDIICFKDSRGRWLEANNFKLELLGLTDIPYKGKTDKELSAVCPACCRESMEHCWVSDQATWFEGIPCTYQEVLTDSNGIQRTFEVIKIPIFYPGGAKKGLLVVGRDITERQRALEVEKQLEAEKARLDRLNLVGEMAVNIGHEIRNPMTTVRGYLQLMQNKLEFSKYQGRFELMISDLDNANAIITNFISLAKNKALRLTCCDLNKLISGLLPEVQTRALLSKKNIAAALGSLPCLQLDEKEISQLVLNLIDNGLHVTPEGQSLEIRTYTDQRRAVLEITDKGPGISADIMGNLGIPFFTTKEGGTGLGLAVCYHIAERHKAKLDIISGAGGTTVKIVFKETGCEVLTAR